MKRTTCLRILPVILLLFAIQGNGLTWKEHSHMRQLTPTALDLIKEKYKDKYPKEIWETFRQFIAQGSWDEDFPLYRSGLKVFLRANNHFMHALSHFRLSDAPFIGMGDADANARDWARSNPNLTEAEEFYGGRQWQGVQNWGFTARDLDSGNMSWQNAVNRYGYTESSKRLAFYTLGFICHLLQDMGCPEHVHDDPHGNSGETGFEMWFFQNFNSFVPGIPEMTAKEFTESFKTLDTFFENLAKIGYSANRFQGGTLSTDEPYIDPNSDLARMFQVGYGSWESEWRLFNYNGEDITTGDFAWDWDDFDKNPLWTKGHDEGEWWPTHLEMHKIPGSHKNDKEGYFYIELSGEAPGDRIRNLFPDAYLPTPLDDVKSQCTDPCWKVENTRGTHLYELIARCVVKPVIEHTAGLVKHYYDIVNHPPYVKSVKVKQGGKDRYSVFWKDKEEINPRTDNITWVVDRNLEKEYSNAVQPGKINIEVIFSEPAQNVKVSLGDKEVQGVLDEEKMKWEAEFSLPDDNSMKGEHFINIEAEDLNDHYKEEGRKLDANPRTPARRIHEPQDYSWKDYEEGADKSYKIKVDPFRVKVDPVKVRVNDQEGNPLTDIRGLVTIGGQDAVISGPEYWGTYVFTKPDEKIEIAASYRLPDGSKAEGKKTLSVRDIPDWLNPQLPEPVVITLSVLQPDRLVLKGRVQAAAPPDAPYPGYAVVRNEQLDVREGVRIPGGEQSGESRNFILEYFLSQFETDNLPADGTFTAKVDTPVEVGSSLTLSVFGSASGQKFQGEKTLRVPAASGTMNFGVITIRAVGETVTIPNWNPDNPPTYEAYARKLSDLRLNPKKKIGNVPQEARFADRVYETTPGAGSAVARGTEVVVTVYDVFERRMPDVEGLRIDDALDRLREMGFQAEYSVGPNAESEEKEHVVYEQSVEPFKEHSPDIPVKLKIWGEYLPTRTVPDLFKMTEEEAQRRLEEELLRLKVVDQSKPPEHEEDELRIYKQEPIARSRVGAHSEVKVWKFARYEAQDVSPQPVPQVPFYAVFEMTAPQIKEGLKVEKSEGESNESYRQRKRAAYSSLGVGDFNFTAVPTDEYPLVFHFSHEALAKYPRSRFPDGSRHACRIKVTFTNQETGQSGTMGGALLLTVVETFDSLEEVMNRFPKVRADERFQGISFINRLGTATQRNERGSFIFGPITPGWTAGDKRLAVEFIKEFLINFECFVATVVYGDPFAPQLRILRRFRDNVLMRFEAGQRLVSFYYRYGPGWAFSLLPNQGQAAELRKALDIVTGLLSLVK
ncbi:MAG: hypothetical protein JXB26_09940 [Candidatus Aminicenantes bacterium]|nr:hypothetical protein [Candidatus Aminicenantes bacterium]